MMYTIKGKELIPVRFYLSQFKPSCGRWSSCKIKSLVTAIAIEEYDLLREARNPVLLLPDSKPIHDPVNIIQKGKFSTLLRMKQFLKNINKSLITVKHLFSKFHLNYSRSSQ